MITEVNLLMKNPDTDKFRLYKKELKDPLFIKPDSIDLCPVKSVKYFSEENVLKIFIEYLVDYDDEIEIESGYFSSYIFVSGNI